MSKRVKNPNRTVHLAKSSCRGTIKKNKTKFSGRVAKQSKNIPKKVTRLSNTIRGVVQRNHTQNTAGITSRITVSRKGVTFSQTRRVTRRLTIPAGTNMYFIH
ncbi:hypothetical protein SNE40_013592 [Patella caerulea]|uniref:Uncharacterized protein n=1 Tax=Patella caerulea TaxID=87958 RepID=A0AAN8JII8_PATCE